MNISIYAAKIGEKQIYQLTIQQNRLTKHELLVDFLVQPLFGGHARDGLKRSVEGYLVGKP